MSAKFSFGYNAQAVVDDQNQIVVAADLCDSSNDSLALQPMLDQVKSNCGIFPVETLADAGYQSLANIEALRGQGCTPFIAMGQEFKDLPALSVEQIRKGEGDRSYYCIDNREMPLASRGKDGYLTFRISESFCHDCPVFSQCRFYGKNTPMVLDDGPREVMKSYVEQARQAKWQETYKWRKAIVEPVFGNIKNKGIRILVRGKEKVGLWWQIACTAHNIEKIIPFLHKAISPAS